MTESKMYIHAQHTRNKAEMAALDHKIEYAGNIPVERMFLYLMFQSGICLFLCSIHTLEQDIVSCAQKFCRAEGYGASLKYNGLATSRER